MGEKISWEGTSMHLSDIDKACEDNEGMKQIIGSIEDAALTEAQNMVASGQISFSEGILSIEQFENESPEFRGALIYHLGQSAMADMDLNISEDFAMFTLSEDIDSIFACAMVFVIDKVGDFNMSMKALQKNMTVTIIVPEASKTVFTKKIFMKTKMACSMLYPWVDFNSIIG